MPCSNFSKYFCTLFLSFVTWAACYAQNAPNISYQTPNVYGINTQITPLQPTNSGGAVPATIYGQTSTYAGSGERGSMDGPAATATFNSPTKLTQDAANNLYISDRDNNVIRKIDANGNVTTFAYGLSQPNGVTITNTGIVYVADAASNSIRKVDPTGNAILFAGGNQSGADGAGFEAGFYYPYAVISDASGNLYVADSRNNTIRMVTPQGVVTTIAGSGSAAFADGMGRAASFYQPSNLTLDAAGNLYVTDNSNRRIRKITPAGVVTTFAGDGSAGSNDGPVASASFIAPSGVATDLAGNFYVTDIASNLVRKINASGIVSTLAGSGNQVSVDGVGRSASFNRPNDVQFNKDGFLFITDYGSNQIRKLVITGYTIDKTLPAGLTFDGTTGIIGGTPTALSAPTDYTITAYNIWGESTFVVNIAVTATTPQIITFPAIADKIICNSDFLAAATSTNPSNPITYISSNPSVATINTNGSIHILSEGVTNITASQAGVGQLLPAVPVTRTLKVSNLPPLPTIKVTPDYYDSCDGLLVSYNAIINGGGNNPSYIWRVNGSDVGVNKAVYSSSTLHTDDIITCQVTNNDYCMPVSSAESNKASLSASPYIKTVVVISSTAKDSILYGTKVTFTAEPKNIQTAPTYRWYVNNIAVAGNNNTFTTDKLNDGDKITCTMASGGKCVLNPDVASNIIIVSVKVLTVLEIVPPNTFTPNGDGINDFWEINSLSASFPLCSVNIYNRYGALLYKSIGYAKPWDALFNGKPVPSGIYYYIIDLNSGRKPLLKGWLSVVK